MQKPAYKLPILKKHPKSRRALLYFGVGIGTLLTLIHLALFFFFNPLIQEKLIQTVNERSQGRYSIDVKNISVNIFTGSLTISGVVLSAHPEVIKQLDKVATPSEMQVKIAKIALRHIQWLTYLNTKKLEIKEIKLVSLSVYLSVKKPSVYKSTADENLLAKLPKLISQFSSGLAIGRILIEDGQCLYESTFAGKLLHHQADGIYLTINRVQVDTMIQTANLDRRILYSESIAIRCSNYRTITPDSVYHVLVGELSASTSDSSLLIKRLEYQPLLTDKEFAAKLLKAKDANLSTTYFKTLKTESVHLKDIDWLLLFSNREIKINKLLIDKPQVYLQSYSKGKSRKQSVTKNIFDRLPLLVTSFSSGLRVDSAMVRNATFRYQDIYPSGRSNVEVENAFVTLKAVRIDTFSRIQSEDIIKNLSLKNVSKGGKVLYCDNILIRFSNCELTAPEGMYKFGISETAVSFADSLLEINKLTLKPLYDNAEFAKQMVYQHDRFDIEVKKVTLKGIQFDRLFKLGDVVLQRIDFLDAQVKVSRDLRAPKNPHPTTAFMPQDAFRDIKFYLKLDTVRFRNMDLTYLERAENSKEMGQISFEKTDLLCTNLTNDPKLMHPGRLAHVEAKTLLMGRGELNVTIDIPLLSKNLNFSYKGSLKEMDVKHFNRFSIPNESVSVEDGRVDAVNFSATVRNGLAQGNLTALYHDLKIHFLRKEDQSVRKVYSAIGNIVLKNNKSRHKNAKPNLPKSEKIEYRRQRTDSFIKFMWVSLKTALASLVKT